MYHSDWCLFPTSSHLQLQHPSTACLGQSITFHPGAPPLTRHQLYTYNTYRTGHGRTWVHIYIPLGAKRSVTLLFKSRAWLMMSEKLSRGTVEYMNRWRSMVRWSQTFLGCQLEIRLCRMWVCLTTNQLMQTKLAEERRPNISIHQYQISPRFMRHLKLSQLTTPCFLNKKRLHTTVYIPSLHLLLLLFQPCVLLIIIIFNLRL